MLQSALRTAALCQLRTRPARFLHCRRALHSLTRSPCPSSSLLRSSGQPRVPSLARSWHSLGTLSPAHAASLSSASSSLSAAALSQTVQNGILAEDDEIFTKGLPKAKFQLTAELLQENGLDASQVQGRELDEQLQAVFDTYRERVDDPFALVEPDLRRVSESVREVIGTDHPVLERIASYFFDVKGKRIRPTLVLLVARALSEGVVALDAEAAAAVAAGTPNASLFARQKRLSEVTEMIHTASLLHDDVIDEADTRRGARSINAMFGNKLAILGGDFLLARASVALARLRNPDVVELISIAIEHLVKGEVMQMKPNEGNGHDFISNVDFYLAKSFYKTASLMANSCKSASLLMLEHVGDSQAPTPEMADKIKQANLRRDVAFEYAKSFGLLFQIVDDLLDFVGSSSIMGKPVHHDLEQGIATLPVLYAAEDFPELEPMIARKFKHAGDVERAIGLVERSGAIERARGLAIACGAEAVAAVMQLPDSDARSALIRLVEIVLDRDR